MMELLKSKVKYDEKAHRYFLRGKPLKGITQTLIPAVFGDVYSGVSKKVLDEAAKRGTLIHSETGLIDTLKGYVSDIREGEAYRHILEDRGLVPVASEYVVTDGKNFASPIDKVFEGDIIADIKCTSVIHYDSVRFQLSWYARQYERLNKRPVKAAYVIWLPKEGYAKPRAVSLKLVDGRVMDEITKAYLAGEDCTHFAPEFTPTLPATPRNEELMRDLFLFLKDIKEKERQAAGLKVVLNEAMLEYGVRSIDNDMLRITATDPTTRDAVDVKKLKDDFPEIYALCVKSSPVKGTLRITVKEKEN